MNGLSLLPPWAWEQGAKRVPHPAGAGLACCAPHCALPVRVYYHLDGAARGKKGSGNRQLLHMTTAALPCSSLQPPSGCSLPAQPGSH